jgi:hypothetical protein
MDRQPDDHLGWMVLGRRPIPVFEHRWQILRWRTGSYTYTDADADGDTHSVTDANGDSDACGRMHRRYLDCYYNCKCARRARR